MIEDEVRESWREIVLGGEEVSKAGEDLRNVDSLDGELTHQRSRDERRVLSTDGQESFPTGCCERSVCVVDEAGELTTESRNEEG